MVFKENHLLTGGFQGNHRLTGGFQGKPLVDKWFQGKPPVDRWFFHGKRTRTIEKESSFSIVFFSIMKPPAGEYEITGWMGGAGETTRQQVVSKPLVNQCLLQQPLVDKWFRKTINNLICWIHAQCTNECSWGLK